MNKIIVANLKMNLNYNEALNYGDILRKYNYDNIIVCPSNIHIDLMHKYGVVVGAQDAYYLNKGAYTGEVSFYQLKDLVKYCIIGHSERRTLFNESNEIIKDKIASCFFNKIIPILCIGETKEEYDNKKTFEIVEEQIKDLNISGEIIIAYEPVYSIGTGIIPNDGGIDNVHTYIKKRFKEIYNIDIKVLYGGSVNLDNCKDICNIESVDGLLIGGASIDVNNLIEIYKKVNL